MTTITGTVTSTVKLGSAAYGKHITVTDTGAVAPVAYGAAGVTAMGGLKGLVLINDGLIRGGDGGGTQYVTGGAGVTLAAGTSLTNAGTIHGGNGGYGHLHGGNGGAGVVLTSATATDTGAIYGGNGYTMGAVKARDGAGGVGALVNGGTLTVTGSVSGGSGGVGGTGVEINGGMVIDAGVIAGGTGLHGQAAAVVVGAQAGTLTLTNGGVLDGAVTAQQGQGDALVLGAGGGTLSGLGSSVTGFDTIAVIPGGTWTLTAGASAAAIVNLAEFADLTAAGPLSLVGIHFSGGNTLALGNVGATVALLSGFGLQDAIDLLGATGVTGVFSNGMLTLEQNNTVIGSLEFNGNYIQQNFVFGSDGHGGTEITFGAGAATHTAWDWPLAVLLHGHMA